MKVHKCQFYTEIKLTAEAENADGDLIQLLPYGEFSSTDGRPGCFGGATKWRLFELEANAVIYGARARKNEIVVDYEHQTFQSSGNGQPAPAAGFFKPDSLIFNEFGMFCRVKWTERARKMIQDGEYKYISPVFQASHETGAVLRLINAALTNNPGLDGMQPVSALTDELVEELDISFVNPRIMQNTTNLQVLTALSLSYGASETDQLHAIEAMKATNVTLTNELKTKTDELASLKAAAEKSEMDTLINEAEGAGKILPAESHYWRTQTVTALKGYLAVKAPITALTGMQTGGVPPTGVETQDQLTADEKATAKSMNLTEAQFLKAKNANAQKT